MTDILAKPLFVFEMANNHMGSVEHGLRILREFAAVAREFPQFGFGFKLQYRHLETFIHPDPTVTAGSKFVQRFAATRLSEEEFLQIKEEMTALGFVSICTPFDELSVGKLVEHGYDVLKIASCSLTDWPLLEAAAKTDKPVVASTAGASLEEIDRVVSFFAHRRKRLALMHCVADYPTPDNAQELNQIDLLRARYPEIPVGFSTHENPEAIDTVLVAVAKGAALFEKHVAVKTEEFSVNAYSATPEQGRRWLQSAAKAFALCGVQGARHQFSPAEVASLQQLRRGVFAQRPIRKGERIDASNVFLAIPAADGQITANDLSKYTRFEATSDIPAQQAVPRSAVDAHHVREAIQQIVEEVRGILQKSGTAIPGQIDLEISHHYGVERFHEYGIAMLTYVNRDYCKKIIVVLPGQTHPEQFHKLKEETFHLVWGDVTVVIDGTERACKPGDIVLVEPGVHHEFSSRNGAVIEELSSTHRGADSFYVDEQIGQNLDRKTFLTYWAD